MEKLLVIAALFITTSLPAQRVVIDTLVNNGQELVVRTRTLTMERIGTEIENLQRLIDEYDQIIAEARKQKIVTMRKIAHLKKLQRL